MGNVTVAGVDNDSTKTGDDRVVVLCQRALDASYRQLALRSRFDLAADGMQQDLLYSFKVDAGTAVPGEAHLRQWDPH